MQIKQITNEKLGETVYCAKHPSGLEIRVMPKKGYSSAYAVFGVKYGSSDTAVKPKAVNLKLFPRVRLISLSISFLKARTSTHLNALQKRAQAQMHTQALKKRLIFSKAPRI